MCRGGTFVIASSCNGKNACRVVGDKGTGFKVACDDSVVTLGEPCDKEGHYSCAADAKRILKCVNKQYVGDDTCKPREKCVVKGELVGCF